MALSDGAVATGVNGGVLAQPPRASVMTVKAVGINAQTRGFDSIGCFIMLFLLLPQIGIFSLPEADARWLSIKIGSDPFRTEYVGKVCSYGKSN